MSKQKRLIGRAIRKQRREQRQMLDQFASIDWESAFGPVIAAFGGLSEELTRLGNVWGELAEAYQESVAREYRMNYRALTVGTKESN